MCEEAGVRLEYLPPYSPDYNSIEEAFAELKMWMRKNYLLAESCVLILVLFVLGV
jgi:transposase